MTWGTAPALVSGQKKGESGFHQKNYAKHLTRSDQDAYVGIWYGANWQLVLDKT